jgi:hypothetical protein
MTSSFSRHVGSQDNNVYALNASTGVPLWSYTTGGPVESSPAVANGVVYVGSDDNNIYAFAPLTGEELSYSILKSAWPDCHDLVERLGSTRMPPSRLVALVTRLVLSRRDGTRPPAVPDVARFRRLIHGVDQSHRMFKQDLIEFLKHRAPTLFERADRLLKLSNDTSEQDFRLPAILAAELASSTKSSEIYFLFLCWLDGRLDNWSEPDDEEHRTLLGAITVLSWFAGNHKACLEALWQDRRTFSSDGRIRTCLRLRDNGGFKLAPLMPPEKLAEVLDHTVTNARGIQGYGTNFWTGWAWWQNLSGSLGDEADPRQWYRHPTNTPFGPGVDNREDKQLEAWTGFINALRWKKQLLFYAQRQWIVNCFWTGPHF